MKAKGVTWASPAPARPNGAETAGEAGSGLEGQSVLPKHPSRKDRALTTCHWSRRECPVRWLCAPSPRDTEHQVLRAAEGTGRLASRPNATRECPDP